MNRILLARGPLCIWLCVGLATGAPVGAQTGAERAAAVDGVRAFQEACRDDAGRLWGVSLCGPLIVVDGRTGLAVATVEPPEGTFTEEGGRWVGHVPEGMQVANTAREWGGKLWSTVRLPFPDDPYLRDKLVAHEAFHRVQGELGLHARDAINGHLDEEDGRYLLRLELRALTTALAQAGASADTAARDAVLFRAERYRRYPGADTLEAMLEMQEGLPEYTGARLALREGTDTAAVLWAATTEFQSRPTYVRALGYGTGPLLGLLLDRVRPDWRRGVATQGFAGQLPDALGWRAPADPAAAVVAAATRYGGAELRAAEHTRATARATQLAVYRRELLEGPALILRAEQLFRSFNPNTLVAMGEAGTVYPTATFSADWGVLKVESGGALLRPSNREVRVSAVGLTREGEGKLVGQGWTLELKPGWRAVAGERAGDLEVQAEQ
jgi:hypothetical protein